MLKSNFNDSKIYDTLYGKLKTIQKKLEFDNKHIGISIFVYTYLNGQISKDFVKYDSFNTLSKELNVSRDTIKRYLKANVPYSNNLFFTEAVRDFNLINGLICEATKELKLQSNLPKKVLAYNVKGEILHFNSREAVARFFNVQSITIRNHIDRWIIGGINDYYLFSKELTKTQTEKLLDLSSLRKTNNCEVWVYEAKNPDFHYGTFSRPQKQQPNLM